MKLKDKFDSPIMRHDLGRNEIEETKEQCVEITEEFAIGFADWLGKRVKVRLNNGNWVYNIELKVCTTKELLEIYKKEQEL